MLIFFYMIKDKLRITEYEVLKVEMQGVLDQFQNFFPDRTLVESELKLLKTILDQRQES